MTECKCSGGTTLIYACSGASDVGELSDRAARKLRAEGCGKMFCLAAIGAQKSGYLESARGADRNIVIDGCNVECGRKNFEKAGIPFKGYLLTDMGFKKGSSPITDESIDKIVAEIKKDL